MTGLESAVGQLTIFVLICKTDYSKPVKQEVNCTVILPPLVFPGSGHNQCRCAGRHAGSGTHPKQAGTATRKAGTATRQEGRQGRQADKAGRPTR